MARWMRALSGWAESHRLTYATLLAALLAVEVVAAGARLTSATAVPPAGALREFRNPRDPRVHAPAPPPPAAAPGSPGAVDGSTDTAPIPAGAPAASPEATPVPASPAACGWDCPYQGPPRAGVYEWHQCGGAAGRCTGDPSEPQATETIGAFAPVTRSLPRRGTRTVTHTGPGTWTFVHAYAVEHTEEYEVASDAAGIHNHKLRVDLSLLGQSRTVRVTQEPPFTPFRYPAALGDIWSGHWDDPGGTAGGDYVCTVIGREELEIGGRTVNAWVVEVRIKLLGPRVGGDVTARLWVVPELTITAQEYQEQSLQDDQGMTYRARWMVTLVSVTPRV